MAGASPGDGRGEGRVFSLRRCKSSFSVALGYREKDKPQTGFSWGAPHTPSKTLTPTYLVAAPLPKSRKQMNLLRFCSSARGALLKSGGGGERHCANQTAMIKTY